MNPRFGPRLERLEASRARAVALLVPHDAAALNRAPAPGRWSALQVLHHVVESEAAMLGYVRKKLQAGASLPRAGLGSRLRRLALQAGLASPLRFKAPAVAASVPDVVEPAALRARWDEVRAGWRALVEAFPPSSRGASSSGTPSPAGWGSPTPSRSCRRTSTTTCPRSRGR